MMDEGTWQLSVDTGGTFTDCLGISPQGEEVRCKVLSTGTLRGQVTRILDGRRGIIPFIQQYPRDFFAGAFLKKLSSTAQIEIEHYDPEENRFTFSPSLEGVLEEGDLVEIFAESEGPILGAHVLTKTPLQQPLPSLRLRLATTRATNALLEKKGAEVAFFVTEGFGDLLKIGDQTRLDLFALSISKRACYYTEVVEVCGRVDAQGREIIPLQLDSLEGSVKQLLEKGVRTAAVVLLHSYRNPQQEKRLAEFLRQRGFSFVVVSSQLAPFMHYLKRAQTTVVDAYLKPLMQRYLDAVESKLHGGKLEIMTSAGGLVSKEQYHPKDSLLSGPAGGVLGAVGIGEQCGLKKIIAFDMGGTSTDVTRYDEEFIYQSTHTVGEVDLFSPALKIETVAAGGGSLCSVRHGLLQVGPESGGAHPGPACYGAGGELCLTDVHLLLGRLDKTQFGIPVEERFSENAFDRLLSMHGLKEKKESYLEGFLQIANERMADTVKKITLREGHDPREYGLVAFGGAGGLHACAIAENLGVRTLLFPSDSGILSARGLHQSRPEVIRQKQFLQKWSTVSEQLKQEKERLVAEARDLFIQEYGKHVVVRLQSAEMRYVGQEASLTIHFTREEDLLRLFEEEYKNIFGYMLADREVELVSLRVLVSSPAVMVEEESFSQDRFFYPQKGKTQPMYVHGEWHACPVVERAHLEQGEVFEGPFLVTDPFSTLIVEPGWQGVKGDRGTIKLLAKKKEQRRAHQPEAAQNELFVQRFRNVVEQMGVQLQRTAHSTNVKERMDYSCCLLDAKGRLVANAPHIPVHLGSLGICVRAVAREMDIKPGDSIITNHPAYGGSHLPDITVITPIFHKNELAAYVANRAHHAEVGGIRPGSMPPEATSLEEEGVVIAPTYLFREGQVQWQQMEKLFSGAKYPTRLLEDNLADLRAQIAANRRGEELFGNLIASYGLRRVTAQLERLYQQAALLMKSYLERFCQETESAQEFLDDGTSIQVTRKRSGEKWMIDFSGTSREHMGNLNATPAIVQSAVLYVLRLLLKEDLPLNEGLFAPIKIDLPSCFLNPRFEGSAKEMPAVVGGNIETSQRLVDTLLKLFHVVACSQGTMNNIVLGTNAWSYYETVCGGSGAGEGFQGASTTQVHMTNTAITDAEIFEHRYPVRLWRFAERYRSGGEGKWCGGNGCIREYEFLEPLSLSILTQHRKVGPYGLEGGQRGKVGRQFILQKSGGEQELASIDGYQAEPGDRLVLHTPGGGGYGRCQKVKSQ